MQALPDEKFESAYTTDTRLMGVLVIYIKWRLSGFAASGKKSRILHQFFYIETTEEGIESYRGIYGDDEDEIRFTEQTMLGGLGSKKVLLTMNEAVFLVKHFAEMTKKFGKALPDEVQQYRFVLERETTLGKDREEALFRKLCAKVDTPNKLINYFLMRYFMKDFSAVSMLAKADVGTELQASADLATLCRNEIIPPEKTNGRAADEEEKEDLYVCESVIEDDNGHRIIVSEVGIESVNGHLHVSSFDISSNFAISPAEAAMKLARSEYVTVYEIAGSVEHVLFELDQRYLGAMQNLCEGGKLYILFKKDNRHMGSGIYLLNDDVKEILFVTVEDQLIVGSYTLAGIKRLENRMMMSRVSNQLIEVAKYEFKEPVLYDYTMSYGGDFVRYVEEIMGFEDGYE